MNSQYSWYKKWYEYYSLPGIVDSIWYYSLTCIMDNIVHTPVITGITDSNGIAV